jgi:hypothetical protein
MPRFAEIARLFSGRGYRVSFGNGGGHLARLDSRGEAVD